MNLDNFTKQLKEVPLDIRLDVINDMYFMDLITELGYREEKAWEEEENEVLHKICKATRKHTLRILQTIQEWEKDGKPI